MASMAATNDDDDGDLKLALVISVTRWIDYFQYLAIENNKNLPNYISNVLKQDKRYAKTLNKLSKNYQSCQILTNLVALES